VYSVSDIFQAFPIANHQDECSRTPPLTCFWINLFPLQPPASVWHSPLRERAFHVKSQEVSSVQLAWVLTFTSWLVLCCTLTVRGESRFVRMAEPVKVTSGYKN
jgi:hypothetical protein